jgi:hypothetical protein
MQHNWLTKGIPTLAEILPKKYTKAKDLKRCNERILMETLGHLIITKNQVERLLDEIRIAESRALAAADYRGAKEYAEQGPLPLLRPKEGKKSQ